MITNRLCRWRKCFPRSSLLQAGGKPAPGRLGANLAAGIRSLALAALVGCSPPAAGVGAEDTARISFQIPRQSAEQALIDFAEQAGVTFIFPYEEASRVEANPLRGLYTREEAIRILLENTGLSPRFGGNGVLSINSELQSDKGKHVNNKSRGFFAQLASAITVALGGGLAQAATDTASRIEIEEVIVTAQKRSERLVDVPISVSNLSANQLRDAGITHARDLTQVVPGLNFSMQGALAQPTIRGIGSTLTAAGDESNTALYIDGVYMSQMYANFFDLPSIERIEVLKGPPGHPVRPQRHRWRHQHHHPGTGPGAQRPGRRCPRQLRRAPAVPLPQRRPDRHPSGQSGGGYTGERRLHPQHRQRRPDRRPHVDLGVLKVAVHPQR